MAIRRALHQALHQERKFGVIVGGASEPASGFAGERAKPGAQVTLGERLRHTRKGKGLTQREVADLLGIKQSTVSRIESGKLSPEERHERAIEEWLSVSLKMTLKARAEDSA